MVFNSLNKFKIYNTTTEKIVEIKYMKKVLKYALKYEKVTNSVFNVIIVDNEEIHRINKTYRKIDKPTDVISFALEDNKDEVIFSKKRVLGDIYISVEKAKEQAKEYNHSEIREFCFLAVHGLLHLLGYDHMNEKDEKIMFGKQELILNGKRFSRIEKK